MFPLDPKAPPKKEKKYMGLPWQCQTMCHGDCTRNEGVCPPERISPKPSMREDRYQGYYENRL